MGDKKSDALRKGELRWTERHGSDEERKDAKRELDELQSQGSPTGN